MAAKDYHNRPAHAITIPPRHIQLSPEPHTPDSIYNEYSSSTPYDSLTPSPSYTSLDRIRPKKDPRYYGASNRGRRANNTSFDDDIPLKPTKRISPLQDEWAEPSTQYPPSLESRRPTGLGPNPTPTKKSFFSRKIPWVVFFVSLVQITVFIAEVARNSIVTGSPIMIHPQFNPMIGPSIYVLINMGARFVPCMRNITQVQDATTPIQWPCPNTTTSDPNNPTNHCDLFDLCGFNSGNTTQAARVHFDNSPGQWFRFIVPMFLHAGIIHIGFNMLLQLTMGREMELAIGSVRFALVYFSSGIFGFVLGGNFAATAIASTGASGCLFGILALTLLDLIYCWGERPNPVRDLMWILCDVLISFVLGLLPGLDNFSHIGGFLMGLVLGICILHSPNILRQRIGMPAVPYSPMLTDHKRSTTPAVDVSEVVKHGFFKGRKPLWWAWWLLRVGALIGVLASFFVLLSNFYKYRDTCSWCKYLSCLPINNWCEIGNLQLSNTTLSNGTNTNNKFKRDLMEGFSTVAMEFWDLH